MKILSQMPAYLLALVFIVFGANFFINFMPMPPMAGDPLTFMNLFGPTGYMRIIKILEIVGGLLLLSNRTRPMGLCIITPIAINILLFEFLIAKQPGIGIIITLLCIAAIYMDRKRFAGIIAA